MSNNVQVAEIHFASIEHRKSAWNVQGMYFLIYIFHDTHTPLNNFNQNPLYGTTEQVSTSLLKMPTGEMYCTLSVRLNFCNKLHRSTARVMQALVLLIATISVRLNVTGYLWVSNLR